MFGSQYQQQRTSFIVPNIYKITRCIYICVIKYMCSPTCYYDFTSMHRAAFECPFISYKCMKKPSLRQKQVRMESQSYRQKQNAYNKIP